MYTDSKLDYEMKHPRLISGPIKNLQLFSFDLKDLSDHFYIIVLQYLSEFTFISDLDNA